MKRWMNRFVPLMCAVLLPNTLVARAQDNINPRAKEDIKTFLTKAEEGDTLFNQKKYAEAAAALAAAHNSYQRAERRDSSAGDMAITLTPQRFPALRYYGYGMGPNATLGEEVTGVIKTHVVNLHNAANEMWMDAAILSDAAQMPLAGAFKDPPMVDLTEDQLSSHVETLYGPVRRSELPVRDDEWHEVVVWSRRAQLILEYALRKYPEWKNDGNRTGDKGLADIKAKLTEAEPEYQKVVADFRKAEPKGFAATVTDELATLNRAISGVKRNGWLDWVMARDLYITKDYFVPRRRNLISLYTNEGKTMPTDKLKPVDDKIAELKSTVDKNAARWRFPTGKPHNAAIETRAKNAVKAKFPGAVIIKSALDSTNWRIEKNEFGLPRYRAISVLVLAKIPGQKWPWLINGWYYQTYNGGGTYDSGGSFAPPWSDVRVQTAQ